MEDQTKIALHLDWLGSTIFNSFSKQFVTITLDKSPCAVISVFAKIIILNRNASLEYFAPKNQISVAISQQIDE